MLLMPHLGREESSFKNRGFVYFWLDIKTPWEYVVQNIFENDGLKRKISVFFFRKRTADSMGREAPAVLREMMLAYYAINEYMLL